MLLLKDKNYLEKTGKLPNSFLGRNNPLPFSGLTYPLPRDPLNCIQRHVIEFILKEWGKKSTQGQKECPIWGEGKAVGQGENRRRDPTFLFRKLLKSHTERPCLIFGGISGSFAT